MLISSNSTNNIIFKNWIRSSISVWYHAFDSYSKTESKDISRVKMFILNLWKNKSYYIKFGLNIFTWEISSLIFNFWFLIEVRLFSKVIKKNLLDIRSQFSSTKKRKKKVLMLQSSFRTNILCQKLHAWWLNQRKKKIIFTSKAEICKACNSWILFQAIICILHWVFFALTFHVTRGFTSIWFQRRHLFLELFCGFVWDSLFLCLRHCWNL